MQHKENVKLTDMFARFTLVNTLQPGKDIEVTDELAIGDTTWAQIKERALEPDYQDQAWFKEFNSADQNLII